MSDPLDKAFAAYLRAVDQGRLSSRQEFLAQYPELAESLAELMQMADSLDAIVSEPADGSTPADDAPGDPPSATAGGAETVAWNANSDAHDGSTNSTVAFQLGKNEQRRTDRFSQAGPLLPYDLGDYTLLEVLGRGGMGVVYLAEQKGLDRHVAVKMIRSGVLASEAEVRRFVMEAKAAAALEHRNIVSVYHSGYLDGHYYFSMEYVPGVDLAKMIATAPLAPQVAARYVRDVARAIHHAHLRGVLHRDLKPANVLITPDDEVRVTDFGLAKQIDTDSSMTGTGAAIGTPSFMAPEQAAGRSEQVQVQSDVYSLGALLFAALSGRAPFSGKGVMETLMQVIHQPAPALRSLVPDAPEDLGTIVAKCLEKSPAQRYQSADALAEELDALLERRPITARPRPGYIRALHWLQQVPLVAALMGRRLVEPTPQHRRFQAVMLGLLIALPLALLAGLSIHHYLAMRIPTVVKVSGGLQGGVYDEFSEVLGQRIGAVLGVRSEVAPSGGSLDNRDALLGGAVHLAPMQAGALGDDRLGVVAPLFFEAVHLLAHADSGISHAGQIPGNQIAVGPSGSGSRLATEMVLQSLGVSADQSPRQVISWPALLDLHQGNAVSSTQPQVAIVCIGRGSRLVSSLLADGQRRWQLLPLPKPIEISLEHPALRPMTIMPSDYRGAAVPEDGVATVGTTAFLVTTMNAPDALVIAALDALYQDPPPIERLIPRQRATEWQGLGFHSAAKRYFKDDDD